MEPVIEVRNLRVFYGTKRGYIRAVDDVNLEIREGEALGLVGESGCGKSTLGRAILGVLPRQTMVRGEILYHMPAAERAEMEGLESNLIERLDGGVEPARLEILDARAVSEIREDLRKDGGHRDVVEDLTRLLELKRSFDITTFPREAIRRLRGEKLVLIFQDPMSRLDPLMTVRDHFLELVKAHEKIGIEEAQARAVRALSSVGIAPTRLRNYPHEFSGGMRQRIMIAMALVMNPDMLIADEPTTSLDVLVEAQILKLIEDLKLTRQMALLLITHNLGIVAETCDRVAVMYAGKVVEIAEASSLFKDPKHPYTEGLLSSIIHLKTTQLSSIGGSPPDLLHPPTGCRFHPRCPHVMEICRTEVPAAFEAGGSKVACFLYGEGSE